MSTQTIYLIVFVPVTLAQLSESDFLDLALAGVRNREAEVVLTGIDLEAAEEDEFHVRMPWERPD